MTEDVFRVKLYAALRPFFTEQRAHLDGRAAEISGRALIDEFGFSSRLVDCLNYPAFDLLNPECTSQPPKYDLVFADMILEHVRNPYEAVLALRRLLRPGGWAVVTSAFIFPIHSDVDGSKDYFRFTEWGLQELFKDWEDVRTGSWGNELSVYVALHFVNLSRSAAGIAAIREPNNSLYPIDVWAIARKPL